MSAENKDYAIDLIIQLEGGDKFTNDPRDPGKGTKYGISQAAYPLLDIQHLTLEQAKTRYAEDYWDPIQGDNLRSGLDLLVFDSAVNQGVKSAIKLLQIASGTLPDGIMGSATLTASAKEGVLVQFARERAMRYATGANFAIYGKGWLGRLFSVFKLAVEKQ